MILHLLYILAFTILAFLAVANLFRNLMTLGLDSHRDQAGSGGGKGFRAAARTQFVPHPELLDETGNVIHEPLLVMRSMSVEDARERLDALYDASPGGSHEPTGNETKDEA